MNHFDTLVPPLQHPVLYRRGKVLFQALSFFLNFRWMQSQHLYYLIMNILL